MMSLTGTTKFLLSQGLFRLFVVRHGDTRANEQGINAGRLDYPLSKRGRKAVQFLAKTLSKENIAAVYASPVFRAQETAKIISRPHSLSKKIKTLEGLTEAKLKPDYVGKKGREHILTDPRAFEETYEELQNRVVDAITEITKKLRGNVLVVSHGDVITALLHHVLERRITPENAYYVLHADPASLTILEYERDAPLKLYLFNYHRKML